MELLERNAAGPDGAREVLSTRLLQRSFVPDDRTPAANTDIGKLCPVTFYTQQTASQVLETSQAMWNKRDAV